MKDPQIDGGFGIMRDEGRSGDWSQTWTGGRFYTSDPRPGDISILDIAMALGNMARYNGHCRFYSVAEHSILVSYMVPSEHALCALAHDFTEAYIADITRPTKRALGKNNTYFELEDSIWKKAIAPKFGLPLDLPECVKYADAQIIHVEKERLFPRSDDWDLSMVEYPEGKVPINGFPPFQASLMLLRRFCELTGADFESLSEKFITLNLEDEGLIVAKKEK